MTTLKAVTNTASEFGGEFKASMEEVGRSAGKKLDHAREETGGALRAAASSVRTTGCRGSSAIDELAASTADRLDTTAACVEDQDLRDVLGGLRRFVRRHLTGSLLAAATSGFLAASALRRATARVQRPDRPDSRLDHGETARARSPDEAESPIGRNSRVEGDATQFS